MLGIGLGANQTPHDFDVMSAISTGKGMQGMTCGAITNPVPGDFFSVSNIDDMLFAFDALNPDPGVTDQGGVCQIKVCPEAPRDFRAGPIHQRGQHPGFGGRARRRTGLLVSPSGQTLVLPKKDADVNLNVDGVPVTYKWQSESAQSHLVAEQQRPALDGFSGRSSTSTPPASTPTRYPRSAFTSPPTSSRRSSVATMSLGAAAKSSTI